MATHELNSAYNNEWNQDGQILAVLLASIHTSLWGCVLFSMTYIVPHFSRMFEDFGIELSFLLLLVIDISHISMRLWPLGVIAILAAAVADWWVLSHLARQPKKSLKHLWFWGNVAAPIMAAIIAAAVIATTLARVTNALS